MTVNDHVDAEGRENKLLYAGQKEIRTNYSFVRAMKPITNLYEQ